MTARLELEGVDVAYQRRRVVEEVGFQLEEGLIGCLLGPSGCGKTTILRAIAGFEPVQAGTLEINGRLASRPGWTAAPEQRRVGMVFQDFALFPHMSVAENVRFGLRRLPAGMRGGRVAELLALVGLADYADTYPHRLSGGQQQRVALARAMAPRPDVLLLDEPFSSMDAELREQIAGEIRAILKQERMTAVLVTHDQYEAFAMADQIGVMERGRIVQWDRPYNLYHRPATRFVAGFVGLGVMLPGTVLNDRQIETELGVLTGEVNGGCAPREAVEVLVRPDDIQHNEASPLLAEVEERRFRGAEFLYRLRLPSGARVLCYAPSHHDHRIGERIGIEIELEHLVMFRREPAKSG